MPQVGEKGIKRKWPKRRLSLMIALLLGSLILQLGEPSPVVRATTFDIPDGNITALKMALSTPGGSHIINLAPGGTYTLTTVDNGFSNGLPLINRTITINGNGATITVPRWSERLSLDFSGLAAEI